MKFGAVTRAEQLSIPSVAEVPLPEYWAYCPPCQRSFYVSPAASPERPSNVACPVCQAPTPHLKVQASA